MISLLLLRSRLKDIMFSSLLVSTIVIVAVVSAATTNGGAVDICQLGPIQEGEANICRAEFTQYTYNSKLGKCELYIYGGCYGSENLFGTLEECKQACERRAKSVEGTRNPGNNQNICNLPSETGRCEALIPRYFYDKKTKRCRTFTYGGCGGNGNNFESLQECRAACGPK